MKTDRIVFRISEEEKLAISAIAKKKDIPLSQLLRELVKKRI